MKPYKIVIDKTSTSFPGNMSIGDSFYLHFCNERIITDPEYHCILELIINSELISVESVLKELKEYVEQLLHNRKYDWDDQRREWNKIKANNDGFQVIIKSTKSEYIVTIPFNPTESIGVSSLVT